MRRREESLQELAEDLERLVRLAYPLSPEEMKDLLAKEQFIDAILDEDARLRLKQSRPHSLRAALTLAMELESYRLAYRLAYRQREFPVRGMYCGAAEGSSTDEPDRGKSQQDEVLAQVKGLRAEVVSSQCFGAPQCWACGKRGHLRRDCWKVGRNKSRDMQNQNFPQPHLN